MEMRRRDFIAIAGCALTTRPLAGVAQQSPKQPRIAIAIPTGNADQIAQEDGMGIWPGLLLELRRLGYVEGINLVVERYSAEDQPERYNEFVGAVVNRSPTLIVTAPNPFARRFAEKTKAIPIVAVMADPIEAGLVTSLAHPGGNLTGVSVNAGPEIWGKRLQIIKDVVPSASRVAYLGVRIPPTDLHMQSLQMAGERLGLSVTLISVTQSTEAAYREVFAATGPGSPDAIVVNDGAALTPYRGLVAELATAHRVPTMFPYSDDTVKRGALMAYGTDLVALGRQLAGQVAKILGGAKPGDIPIEQASRFFFAINLKTAGAMGFTFPPAVLAVADEVIE
jgi:putative tryptophan/tyrosine transport system substrate-binding protein